VVGETVTRVFITGIAGFLGSHIAREGRALGWDVAGIDSMLGGDASNVPPGIAWSHDDCRDFRSYRDLLAGADVVYHCAAAPYEGLSVFSPNVVFENTLMSTAGILTAAVNAGVRRFIFCSSMSRYGHQPAPFTEDMPVMPADPYAIAKAASEDLTRNLCEIHQMEWVIAVPHNIYGPGQRYWDPFRNVAGIMINLVLQGRPPVIYGNGLQRRCLSYISDVTEPLLRLATGDVAGEVFNIGPDGDDWVQIRALAEMILHLIGSSLEPVFFPPRPGEVFEAHCSADKARKMLDYAPRTELPDGLTRYISWIRMKGPRPFEYHLPVEISSKLTPRTWTERLI
jgi:UDP-glucose 4-epimerase